MPKLTIISFFLLLLSVSVKAQNLDIDLLESINVNRDRSLDGGFKFISDAGPIISFATPVSLLAVAYFKHDKTLLNKAYVTGAAVIASVVITQALKYGIDRRRPYNSYSQIQNEHIESSPSFPSGHTSAIFATATSLSLAFPKWYVIAPAYTVATSVAYSRMFLGVHYPSDVLAGMIIGAGSSYLSYKISDWLRKK